MAVRSRKRGRLAVYTGERMPLLNVRIHPQHLRMLQFLADHNSETVGVVVRQLFDRHLSLDPEAS